ncbi:MAG: response regulator transcription factor [Candidatus Polarisedimenticolia bacterium]
MMVSCPGCNNNYSLDERKISPRGATLTCAQCGKKWSVRPPVDTEAPPDAAEEAQQAQQAHPIQPEPTGPMAVIPGSINCPLCGHTFNPTAPASPHAAGAASATAPRPSTAQRRILIIEDQNYFAELTRDSLGAEFETTVVPNVTGARGAISAGRFDLVILDLSLEEGQDGAQLLGTIRKMGTPVLVFTARDETELYGETWKSLQGAGATDILIKGVNVGEELRQKVRALLAPRP